MPMKFRLPEDLETYSVKANYCFLIGKYEEAEQIMKKAILKRPLKFDLHYNMAMVYQAQQKKSWHGDIVILQIR